MSGRREAVEQVRRVADRHRRQHRAVQRVPRAAWHPDARSAHGAPLRERAHRGALPRVTARRPARVLPGPAEPPAVRRSRSASCAPAAACSRSTWAAGTRRQVHRRPADAAARPPRSAASTRCAVHPPSHTHRQLDEAALAAAGIPRGSRARLRRVGGRGGPDRRLRRPRSAASGSAVARLIAAAHRPHDLGLARREGGPRATLASAADAHRPPLDPLARAGRFAWRTLTSVRFAVLQITLLVVAGLIGTLVRQLPAFALRRPCGATPSELAEMHRRVRRRQHPRTPGRPGDGRPLRPAGLLPRLQRAVVHRADDAARGEHRRLHARPDATPVARRQPTSASAQPAAVLRPSTARAGALRRRRAGGPPSRGRHPALAPLQGARGGRPDRPGGPPRLRRPEPVPQDGHAVHASRPDPLPGRWRR